MKHIYISCCSPTGGIRQYRFSEGKLIFKEKVSVDRPMYAITDGARMHILLRESSDEMGGVQSCRIRADGTLTDFTEISPSHGNVPCHLTVHNGNIFLVNYLSGNVVKLPDTVTTHTGHSIHPVRQTAPHTHFITAAPDGNLLCTDLGLDRIVVYDTSLNELSHVQLPAGCGPRHLVFSEDMKTVYCANELQCSVTALQYADGRLKICDTYPLLSEPGNSSAAAIRIQGAHLYVSVRGANCIVHFLAEGEKLQYIDTVACEGNSPRDFEIVDRYLICACELSDTVTLFALKNGTPHYLETIEVPEHPLCVTVWEDTI